MFTLAGRGAAQRCTTQRKPPAYPPIILIPPRSRFGSSSLHQRDSRHDLFKGYTGSGADSRRPVSASPNRSGGYGYSGYDNPRQSSYPAGPSAGYAGPGSSNGGLGVDGSSSRGGYRPATPNSRGQYSDAVLNELESQNDAQVEGILGKVKILKDVRLPQPPPFF